MTEEKKRKQLFRYKVLASGLFLLMACICFTTTILQKNHNLHWIGYVHAFSEAAMIGALADWYATTAIFHNPLGIKIPHTNLIENSKEKIGYNLGNFFVVNFASREAIRPYIENIKVSRVISDWILKKKNQDIVAIEATILLKNAISQIHEKDITTLILSKKGPICNIKVNNILSNLIFYLMERNKHQEIISFISSKIKNSILENENIIREKVYQNSYAIIPKFINNKIANKIISSLKKLFEDIENNPNHPIRYKISNSIYKFSNELKNSNRWENEIKKIKQDFLNEEKLNDYLIDICNSLKKKLVGELENEDSELKIYAQKNVKKLAEAFNKKKCLQNKIDQWIRFKIYRLILKKTDHISEFISTTVNNWKGKELSKKLELEIGKDLQFIRINGTIVGGLVGLLIYTLTYFL